ncbi:hypothetical protein JD844_017971 [Phrynosoma platyrhinos]|uniref:Uncharacterized protein n=1 Tax=Phrynosoma platyrhinos TaxID=52577 RepID=A0ABQ7SMR5_PHRPL|nr:hypothetical protein JD844_017971 [Phrynosoma platyrhinos]
MEYELILINMTRDCTFSNKLMSLKVAEDNETFKTIVEFECRGLEPVDFQPQVSFYEYFQGIFL